MADLETLQDLLNRAGWHLADKPDSRDQGYTVKPADSRQDGEIELLATGEWTGELTALFDADGTIRSIMVYGD